MRVASPPRTRSLAFLLCASLGLAGWTGAPRPARADAVRVQLVATVPEGQTPLVKLQITESVEGVEVDLTRDDGKKVTARLGALAAGTTRDVALPGDPGRHQYEGTIAVVQRGNRQEHPLRLDAVVAPTLRLDVDRAKIDVTARRLEARLSRPPARAEIQVFGPRGGEPIARAEQPLKGPGAGEPFTITWPEAGGEVLRIDLRVYDQDGFYTGVALQPWSVYIPHEEVGFATDSATITPTEAPKLAASLAKINEALAQRRALGPVKLFVAGHTDTVGGAAYNVKLSQRRAQAIAAWFRANGLRLPILFEGFGEHAPLRATADETDEPRNRRVDYILAIEEPNLKASTFRPAWKRVP